MVVFHQLPTGIRICGLSLSLIRTIQHKTRSWNNSTSHPIFCSYPHGTIVLACRSCEANAFGLPVIATATGGTPEVVKDGENGFLLPFTARGDAYAEIIKELFHDEQRYSTFVQSSRAAFDNRLNWDAWGSAAATYISGDGEVPRGSERAFVFVKVRVNILAEEE